MTVSTVGLAPAIRKLADERLQVTLAVSLHTPYDELVLEFGGESAGDAGLGGFGLELTRVGSPGR